MIVLFPDGAKPSSDPIADILKSSQTVAVVGLSSNPMRPSNQVASYLKAAGYRIMPVNPNEREVFGERSYPRLEDVPVKIDIVDIFRKPEDVPPAVDGAIRIGARVVWMQLGIEHAEAAEKARQAGLVVVMDACALIEHRRRAREISKRH